MRECDGSKRYEAAASETSLRIMVKAAERLSSSWLSDRMTVLDVLWYQRRPDAVFRVAAVVSIFAVLVVAVVVCGDRFGPIDKNDYTGNEIWAQDKWRRSAGIGHLVATPLIATAFSLIVNRTLSTILWWQPHVRVCCTWPIGGVCMLVQGYAACLEGLRDDLHPCVRFYFRLVLSFLCACLALSGLDNLEHTVTQLVRADDDQKAKEHIEPPYKFWWEVMLFRGSWGDASTAVNGVIPKVKEDALFATKHRSTPAHVLLDLVRLFRLGSSLAIGVILLAIYVRGADQAADDDSEFVAWFDLFAAVGLLCAAVSGFVLSLSSTVRSLVGLTLSGTMRMGDVVSFSDARSPTTEPGHCIVGHIENFTYVHVVIRDFKCNQVFLSYSDLERLVAFNWTRRPSKQARLKWGFRSDSNPAALTAVRDFCRDWITAHPGVENSNYTKACFVGLNPGYVLEVIFYPKVGKSRNTIRDEFCVSIGAAALRLGLRTVPLALMEATEPCSLNGESANDGPVTTSLDDLFPKNPRSEMTENPSSLPGNSEN